MVAPSVKRQLARDSESGRDGRHQIDCLGQKRSPTALSPGSIAALTTPETHWPRPRPGID